MYILGISAFYHDSAACLLQDGQIIAAAEEERFSRLKHDNRFPQNAIAYCLYEAGISLRQIECIAFYDKPFRKFRRLLATYLDYAPQGLESWLQAMPLWLGGKLLSGTRLRHLPDFAGQVVFTEHHESHAASAFYPSPYSSAAILTLDGVGEWTTTACGAGRDNDIELFSELRFPHSLGLLYSAFTYYTGFRVNSGEYKLMGLAPYGEPKYTRLILERLGDFREDGSLWLDMRYFNYCNGLTMTSTAFDGLFGGPPRAPESPITTRETDLARSIQDVTELCMLRTGRHIYRETGERNLCMAGGVALNCVANGRLLREGPFEDIWVQPAAGDSGGALGAALSAWHQYYGRPRCTACRSKRAIDAMGGAYLGPGFHDGQIRELLESQGIPSVELNRKSLLNTVAVRLADEQVIGWFQGRMEFGPRALGNRSILADPRSPRMQSLLNEKIKLREGFRPFAPAVLYERAADFFDLHGESPYMLFVAPLLEALRLPADLDGVPLRGLDQLKVQRSRVPAVTHVDYSARLQTVRREHNPLFYDLIAEFDRITGCPMLINTSFNIRGEPIVCQPIEALRCFARTEMDCLVMGSFLIERSGALASVSPLNGEVPLD